MSKIKNNPIMKGASGMLGDVVVYREVRGNVIMSNRPKKSGVLTPHQETARSRFLRAVQFAKRQTANPVTKAEYQPDANSRFFSAYSRAMADYLSSPIIHNIDASRYGGVIGDEVLIRATDDFKVTLVNVSIFSAGGNLLEQGDAVLLQDAVEDYVYTATVANAALPGTKVLVTVRDKPGNLTVEEKVL